MTTDRYLRQVIRFERVIPNKLREIERCKAMATSITVQPKDVNVQVSSDKDKIGSKVARIVDLENEISEMESIRDAIIKQIDSIEDSDMYSVLYGVYISNRKIADVRHDIHCSKTTIYRIFDDAMTLFEEKYGEKYLNL